MGVLERQAELQGWPMQNSLLEWHSIEMSNSGPISENKHMRVIDAWDVKFQFLHSLQMNEHNTRYQYKKEHQRNLFFYIFSTTIKRTSTDPWVLQFSIQKWNWYKCWLTLLQLCEIPTLYTTPWDWNPDLHEEMEDEVNRMHYFFQYGIIERWQ